MWSFLYSHSRHRHIFPGWDVSCFKRNVWKGWHGNANTASLLFQISCPETQAISTFSSGNTKYNLHDEIQNSEYQIQKINHNCCYFNRFISGLETRPISSFSSSFKTQKYKKYKIPFTEYNTQRNTEFKIPNPENKPLLLLVQISGMGQQQLAHSHILPCPR